MKVSLPKLQNIIQFPEEPARLESVGDDGSYVYTITYSADPRSVITNNVTQTEIVLSNVSYVTKVITPVFKKTKNGEAATKNILTAFAKEKDAAKSALKTFISKQASDISSVLPNDKIAELSNTAKSGMSTKVKPVISTSTVVESKKVSEVKKENFTPPVVAINLNATNASAVGSNTAVKSSEVSNKLSTQQLSSDYFKATSERLLYVTGIDPASMFNKSNNLPSVKKTIAGSITPKLTTQTELVKSSPGATTIISSLINQINIKSIRDLGDDDYIDVVKKGKETKVYITETITVAASDIVSGRFYVTIFLIDAKGRKVQHITHLVNHTNFLKIYQIPTMPPIVTAMPVNRPGKIAFFVQQRDPKANAINIYRRELSSSEISIVTDYKFVGKLDITNTEPAKRVTDTYAGNNNCIYRFVPVANNDYQASIFASAGIQISNTNLLSRPQVQRPKYGSINCTPDSSGMGIRIESIPYGPVAIKVFRKDLTLKEVQFKLVNDTVYPIGSLQSRALDIVDQNVKKGRIYEYICKYVFREGDEVTCAQNCIVEFASVETNLVRTSIIEQNIVEKSDGADVQFTIEYSPLLNNSELIKSLMKNQALTTEFQDEITKDRSNLNKLFVSTVLRKNLTTGEQENFGVIDSVNFSDRKYGTVKGVKAPESGNDYEYVVTTYVRSPETVFPELVKTVASKPGRRGYSYSPNKWQQPLSLRTGNIIGSLANKTNYAKPEIIQGDIADIQTTRVSLTDIQPSIAAAEVTKIRKDAVLLRWQIQGNPNKVDHFIIVRDKMGMREIVSTAHAITRDRYFELVLEDTDQDYDGCFFIIDPVYYDNTLGKEFKTNIISY
jgi:hypothetical protein